MKLFGKIRMKRAKRHLNRALKIISKLSWEELDSLFPKADYCNAFKNCGWGNVKFDYPEFTMLRK